MNSVEFEIKARNNASGALKDAAKDVSGLKQATDDGGQAAQNAGRHQDEFKTQVGETGKAARGTHSLMHAWHQFMAGDFVGAIASAAKGLKFLASAMTTLSFGPVIAAVVGFTAGLVAMWKASDDSARKAEELKQKVAETGNAADAAAKELVKLNQAKLDGLREQANAVLTVFESLKKSAATVQAAIDKLKDARMGAELAENERDKQKALLAAGADPEKRAQVEIEFEEKANAIRNRHEIERAKKDIDGADKKRVQLGDELAKKEEANKLEQKGATDAAQAVQDARNKLVGAGVYEDPAKLALRPDLVAKAREKLMKDLGGNDEQIATERSNYASKVTAVAAIPNMWMALPSLKKKWEKERDDRIAVLEAAGKKKKEAADEGLTALGALPELMTQSDAQRKRAADSAERLRLYRRENAAEVDATNFEGLAAQQRLRGAKATGAAQSAATFIRAENSATQFAEQRRRDEERRKAEDAAYWERANQFTETSRTRDAKAGAQAYVGRLRGAGVPASIVSAQSGEINAMLGGGDAKAADTFAKLHAAWMARDAKLIAQVEAMVRDLLRQNRNITTQGF